MNIERFNDVILSCRFCFMCRHLSGVANVTFTEADTPRVRAALLYAALKSPEKLNCPDLIAAIYRADLSRACARNCVNHYDESGLLLAARQDIVEAGIAPEPVKALAAELKASAKWEISGSGDVLYFEDERTAEARSVAPAFAALMKKANVPYRTVKGGCIGKALKTLGFVRDSEEVARAFAGVLNDARTPVIVVSNPAAYDALTRDYPAFGIKLNAKVMHSSEYIASLGIPFTKKAGELYYLESDFLRNYDQCDAPAGLLKLLGAECKPFGTNDEESYSCGEGALILPRLDEELVKKLARYVEARADHPESDRIVVASSCTKLALARHTRLKVETLEELAASCL